MRYVFTQKTSRFIEIEAESEAEAKEKAIEAWDADWETEDFPEEPLVLEESDEEGIEDDPEYEKYSEYLIRNSIDRYAPFHNDARKMDRARHLMNHAIGYNNTHDLTVRLGRRYYKPYRNCFSASKALTDSNGELWQELVSIGFAESRESEQYYFFSVTREGLNWLTNVNGFVIKNPSD